MAMVDVDGSCQFSADSQSQPKSIGLVTQRSVNIHQMNCRRNDYGNDDSSINIENDFKNVDDASPSLIRATRN